MYYVCDTPTSARRNQSLSHHKHHHHRGTRMLIALRLYRDTGYFCRQVDDDDHRVCHLALLSQYAVFKDIIPGYRIRVPTAAEMATKVSKDVHRMRTQEAALLRAYQVWSIFRVLCNVVYLVLEFLYMCLLDVAIVG